MAFFTRSLQKHNSFPTIETLFCICTLSLCTIGIVLLYSAAQGSFYPWASRQLCTLVVGVVCFLLASFFDTKILYENSYRIYFICLSLLIIAQAIGYTAMGAQRWLRFGAINIQPSEFMKLAVIMSLSRYFHDLHSSQAIQARFLIIPITLSALPILLILKQPNLGTALLILVNTITILFLIGLSIKIFIWVAAITVSSVPIIWQFFLHGYQKKRILIFLFPEKDSLGAGYNIIQSKIAIGSGGTWGKGLLQGTQNQLSFLPEKQTDFIFTLLAEEFGYVGVIVVLFLYMALILLCYLIAFRCTNQYARLISLGYGSLLFIHVAVNLSMISGMLPVVGIPLPFLSYGGSNLLTMLFGATLVYKCASMTMRNNTEKF